jgi:integrase
LKLRAPLVYGRSGLFLWFPFRRLFFGYFFCLEQQFNVYIPSAAEGKIIMPRLTKRVIDALAPRAKPFIAFDADVTGFGVRVMPSGLKSFILEYRPGAGGRNVTKRRMTLGRYGTMAPDQARKAALAVLAHVRLGADPQAEKSRQRASLTVADLIDAFLDSRVAKLKPNTRAAYAESLGKLRLAHGAIKAEALTRVHVATLHRSLSAAPYAANRMAAIISSLYAWAESSGLVPEGHRNPAARLTRFKERSRERFLTSDELARLGDALAAATAVDPFAIAAIRLLILTGARLREILHARWDYVDFERGIIFLPDSKTGKKPIYLNAAALAVLADLPRLEGNPHVFPGRKDGLPRDGLYRPWSVIRKAAGLDELRIHDLRHSFASIGAGASLGLPIIGKLLGHSQSATTARYAHLANDPVRAAAETIGATISAAMSRKPGAEVVTIKRAK